MNQFGRQTAFKISEATAAGAAHRWGVELARRLNFTEIRAEELAIIITEAATNILKHAVRGEILLRPMHDDQTGGVEVVAIDSGPGIANLPLQMTDGNSTTGTYGGGLGAMRRMASSFEIYTLVGKGTVIAMKIWNLITPSPASQWKIGAICLPMPGEYECGDAWHAIESDGLLNIVVADGLGHGPDAAKASNCAVEVIKDHPNYLPGQVLEASHTAMRGTRGSAVAVLRIEQESAHYRFAGIGNIAGCVIGTGTRRHLLSHNGIVGSNIRKVQEFSQPWKCGELVVLHSDGIGTRWDLNQYPALEYCDPALIAAVLYRDFSRQRDDSTVIVVRER